MAVVQEIKVPLLAVNDTLLTVVDIPFEQGAPVKKGDVIIVFESSKTTYDVIAEADGFISYMCRNGEEYEVNHLVANILSGQEEAKLLDSSLNNDSQYNQKAAGEQMSTVWEGDTLFSLAALALMKKNNLEATVFTGKDFVSTTDVEEKLGIVKATTNRKLDNKPTQTLPIDPEKVDVKKLTPTKKKEIEYLSSIQSTGLTSTINTIIETNGLFVNMNKSLQYLKNSFLPVVIYETSRLLTKYKELNGYFTGNGIALYRNINPGFAIDIDKGLKVLKIKEASQKTLRDIEQQVFDLSNKYLDDALELDDVTDITFTITDLSAEGVSFFKPLVNRMNSAILGISSIDKKTGHAVFSVTFDHRVTEGKLVANFLQELKTRIESYRSLQGAYMVENISCFKCFKQLKDDLSDVGFSKCITPKGEEAYICQTCFKGF